MNLFELLFFLMICLVLGFLAHLIFPVWGWWIGALAALALMLALLLAPLWRLLSDKIREKVK